MNTFLKTEPTVRSTHSTSSTITCPHCQAIENLEIPKGFSQHLYRCPSCAVILKPKSGDCCIFCSFGSVDCSSSEQNLAT